MSPAARIERADLERNNSVFIEMPKRLLVCAGEEGLASKHHEFGDNLH
jgi:hypothetical protein